jgi:integrase
MSIGGGQSEALILLVVRAHPQHVVLKHRPGQHRRREHLRRLVSEPAAEVPQLGQVGAHRARRRVTQQPHPGPALRRLVHPRLYEPVEPEQQITPVGQGEIGVRRVGLAPRVLRPERLPATRSAAPARMSSCLRARTCSGSWARGSARETPIHPQLRRALADWLQGRRDWDGASEGPALFLNRRGSRLTPRGAHVSVRALAPPLAKV